MQLPQLTTPDEAYEARQRVDLVFSPDLRSVRPSGGSSHLSFCLSIMSTVHCWHDQAALANNDLARTIAARASLQTGGNHGPSPSSLR